MIKYLNDKMNKKGFTLMEVLVSTSIFVIVVLASMSIYISVLKASQKTTAISRIQQESQVMMEILVKQIRTSVIDYNYTGYSGGIDTVNGETELSLINSSGDDYVFALSGESLTININDEGVNIIPSTNISIDDLRFYIFPAENPFSLDAPPTTQPYVTIVMDVSSTKGAQSANMIIQQTVPQRSGVVE